MTMMSKRYGRYMVIVFLFLIQSLYFYQDRLKLINSYLDYRNKKIACDCTLSTSRILMANITAVQKNNRQLMIGKTFGGSVTDVHDVILRTKDKLIGHPKHTPKVSARTHSGINDDTKTELKHDENYQNSTIKETRKYDNWAVGHEEVIDIQNTNKKHLSITQENCDRNISKGKKANWENSSQQDLKESSLITNRDVIMYQNEKQAVPKKSQATPQKDDAQNNNDIRETTRTGDPGVNINVDENVTVGLNVTLNVILSNNCKLNQTQDATVCVTTNECKPSTPIVFLKTHKTGSSTITSIFQRYGFSHNLNFVIPNTGHVISTGLFKRSDAKMRQNDMLVNHVRYNRKEMDAVMKPDAKYITILRDPATQAESVFGYFQLFHHLHLSKHTNPFEEFISKPQYYMDKYPKFPMRNHLKNPLLYDLGLEPSKQSNSSFVQTYIETLSREFELVLLQEYFNESLLLLKKLLCWEMDDILYIIKGVRIHGLRFVLSENLKKKSREWNNADMKLYDFFNTTFWRKVVEYGPDFKTDLKIFEEKLNKTFTECTILNGKQWVDHRAYTYLANPVSGKTCRYMLMSDEHFTSVIRNSAMVSAMLKWRRPKYYPRNVKKFTVKSRRRKPIK